MSMTWKELLQHIVAMPTDLLDKEIMVNIETDDGALVSAEIVAFDGININVPFIVGNEIK
jgi:hypothetical protein